MGSTERLAEHWSKQGNGRQLHPKHRLLSFEPFKVLGFFLSGSVRSSPNEPAELTQSYARGLIAAAPFVTINHLCWTET
jgi:hypothetical protein